MNQKKISPREADDALSEGLIEGRNAVTEALRSGRTINKVFLASGDTDRALGRLAAMAKDAGAVVVSIDRRKLNEMSPTGAHQGIIASVAAHEYASVDDMLAAAAERGEAPLLVLCDELSDPHNLGAIIRTAECAGAHGVIIPKRRSVGLTAVVGKASAGALEYMPVARVSNISSTIRDLKQRGVWIFGTAADGVFTLNDGRTLPCKTGVNGKVRMGIRPEAWSLGGDIAVTLTDVEMRGQDQVVTFRLEEHTIRAILGAEEYVTPGQTVGLRLSVKRCHLFDCETGVRL